MERKDAELVAIRCEFARQMAERDESVRIYRRDMSAIGDDFGNLEAKYRALQSRIVDTEEEICKKNILINELTNKLEDFENIEIVEEKEVKDEKDEKGEKDENGENSEKDENGENLMIMISEIDTDEETVSSNSSSPGTLV